jgi:DNA-binding transcriptional ArsR family regulator
MFPIVLPVRMTQSDDDADPVRAFPDRLRRRALALLQAKKWLQMGLVPGAGLEPARLLGRGF